jgi:hypothetical protein
MSDIANRQVWWRGSVSAQWRIYCVPCSGIGVFRARKCGLRGLLNACPSKEKEVADQQKVTQTRKQSEHLDKSSFANRLIQSGIDRLMNRALFQVLR